MSFALQTARRLTRHELVLLLLSLSCYAYFFPRWADWNQNARFDLVRAMVDDHTVAIDKYVANTGDYAMLNGHYYSEKAPMVTWLGVPVYAVFEKVVPARVTARLTASAGINPALTATLRQGGQRLQNDNLYVFLALTATTFFAVALPCALFGIVFFWTARAFDCSTRLSFTGTLLYLLATSAFPYANAFVSHQLDAALLFGAFALAVAVKLGKLGPGWVLVIGLLLGVSVATEFPSVLLGTIIAGYIVLNLERKLAVIARLAVGGLVPGLALVIQDWVSFHSILPVGYLHSALFADQTRVGFFGMTTPHLDAAWGLSFSPYRGLFFLSPYLLLCVPGFAAIWREKSRRAEIGVLALVPSILFISMASSALWDGGFAVGPRYLVPAIPFLALPATVAIGKLWERKPRRAVAVALSVWSFIAVWAETIGGQSFPDYSPNPLFSYSLPRLASGEIARNVGMLLKLSGWSSILPLGALVCLLLIPIVRVDATGRHQSREPQYLQEKPLWL